MVRLLSESDFVGIMQPSLQTPYLVVGPVPEAPSLQSEKGVFESLHPSTVKQMLQCIKQNPKLHTLNSDNVSVYEP